MPLTVLVGGARSGKSAAAEALAVSYANRVVYLATATPGDEEMMERIERHRRDRPADWDTLELPIELRAGLEGIAGSDTVIVDCLTLWLSNMMGSGENELSILAEAKAGAAVAARRSGETIVVTNEVGLGIVPETPLGRHFRDIAGRVNRVWVERANRSGFIIAGRILPLIEFSDWKDVHT